MDLSYQAKLEYDFKRNVRSPYIYFITQIPTPIISNGKLEFRNFKHFQQQICMVEFVGAPRYCEWGVDVQECRVVHTLYKLDSVLLMTPKGRYMLYYYYEDGSLQESQEVAKNILWNRLFGMKN